MDVCRVCLHFVALSLLAGCTAATPTVTSIGKNITPFWIAQNEIRVFETSDLNAVTVTANCAMVQTEFYLEIPDTDPPIPMTPFSQSSFSSPITSVINNCQSSQTLQVTLNLNGFADFNDIFATNGAFRTLRFEDQNMTGLKFTDEIKIVFSNLNLKQERFIFGQGNNNTICQGSICLKGRVVNVTQSETLMNAPFTLKGRVVYR